MKYEERDIVDSLARHEKRDIFDSLAKHHVRDKCFKSKVRGYCDIYFLAPSIFTPYIATLTFVVHPIFPYFFVLL